MLKEKEQKIVLDYLYQESLKNAQTHTKVKEDAQRIAKLEAKIKFDRLPQHKARQIYSDFIYKKIVEYIEEDISQSSTMYWVNGSPQKRKMRIKEYAHYAFIRMPENQKIAICDKLGYEYIK